MDRVVSQLLAEMDGLQQDTVDQRPKEQVVFVIGATNRPGKAQVKVVFSANRFPYTHIFSFRSNRSCTSSTGPV